MDEAAGVSSATLTGCPCPGIHHRGGRQIAPTPESGAVEVERCSLTHIVTLRGHHDGGAAGLLAEALQDIFEGPLIGGARLVLVDVCPVEHCDGAIAAVLVDVHDAYCHEGHVVLVVAVARSASRVKRMLRRTGVCDAIPTFPSRQEALGALEIAYLEALWSASEAG